MTERIEVTTYFLEMKAPPRRPPAPAPIGATVVLAKGLSAGDYRQLYLDVGARWLWYERADLQDAELEQIISEAGVSIYLLMYQGQCAGYSELRVSTTASGDREVQILYFGLKPAFIGKGLGRFFLDWSVQHSFAEETQRLWVHTCSLDHDRALATYEGAGFREFHREYGFVRIPQAALDRQDKIKTTSAAARPSPTDRSD